MARSLPILAWLALLPSGADAQLSQRYSEQVGDYTVYYSVAPASTLPAQIKQRYHLAMGPDTEVLDVAVDEHERNVKADVHAHAVNASGQRRDIHLREIEANGLVSYLGVVYASPGESLDFTLEVFPAGAIRSFDIRFRERLRGRTRTPFRSP